MKKDTAVIDRRYSNMDAKNKLYFGDNLKILREYVPDPAGRDGPDPAERDPPFNSSPSAFARGGERKSNRATYDVLFKEKSGEESAAQITAFEDAWQSFLFA